MIVKGNHSVRELKLTDSELMAEEMDRDDGSSATHLGRSVSLMHIMYFIFEIDIHQFYCVTI